MAPDVPVELLLVDGLDIGAEPDVVFSLTFLPQAPSVSRAANATELTATNLNFSKHISDSL